MDETPTRDQLIKNIIENARQSGRIDESGSHTNPNWISPSSAAAQIVADPIYQNYEKLSQQADALCLSLRDVLEKDYKTYYSAGMTTTVEAAQKAAEESRVRIREVQKESLHRMVGNLLNKQDGHPGGKDNLAAVFNAVLGSEPGERGASFRNSVALEDDYNYQDNELLMANFKKNHPKLFDGQGKLSEVVKEKLHAAQANNGIITSQEFAEIEKLVVPSKSVEAKGKY